MSTTRPQITTFHENNARRFDNIVTNAPYKPAIPFTIIIRIGLDQSTDTNLDFLQLETTFHYCPTSPDQHHHHRLGPQYLQLRHKPRLRPGRGA